MVEVPNNNNQQQLNEANKNQSQPSQSGEAGDGFDKLDKSGEIEPQGFNPQDFIGKDALIESIDERIGQYGFFIVVKTEPVDDGGNEIRASKMFGLQQDKEGNWGWGPESKLAVFLNKQGVNHYKELVDNPQYEKKTDNNGRSYRVISGKPKFKVKLQTGTNKQGKEFLTF